MTTVRYIFFERSYISNMEYVYTFNEGDDLRVVAKRYMTTVSLIVNDNRLTGAPHAGMRLLIRPHGSLHYVKPFEKLSSVAASYNLTVDQIREANKLTSDTLFVGQVLVIPRNNEKNF